MDLQLLTKDGNPPSLEDGINMAMFILDDIYTMTEEDKIPTTNKEAALANVKLVQDTIWEMRQLLGI